MGYAWIFLIILAVIVIYIIGKSINKGESSSGRQKQSALDTLKRRYAEGEIDRNEFKKMEQDLKE
jgi:uncharacterized membrane protein